VIARDWLDKGKVETKGKFITVDNKAAPWLKTYRELIRDRTHS